MIMNLTSKIYVYPWVQDGRQEFHLLERGSFMMFVPQWKELSNTVSPSTESDGRKTEFRSTEWIPRHIVTMSVYDHIRYKTFPECIVYYLCWLLVI